MRTLHIYASELENDYLPELPHCGKCENAALLSGGAKSNCVRGETDSDTFNSLLNSSEIYR